MAASSGPKVAMAQVAPFRASGESSEVYDVKSAVSDLNLMSDVMFTMMNSPRTQLVGPSQPTKDGSTSKAVHPSPESPVTLL